MNKQEIRLECLKLAASRQFAQENIFTAADRFLEWIEKVPNESEQKPVTTSVSKKVDTVKISP